MEVKTMEVLSIKVNYELWIHYLPHLNNQLIIDNRHLYCVIHDILDVSVVVLNQNYNKVYGKLLIDFDCLAFSINLFTHEQKFWIIM